MSNIINKLVPNNRANWAQFGPNICIAMRRLDSASTGLDEPNYK